MEDEQRSPSDVLRRNIQRLRTGQRLTYVELSERLKDAGRPIPVLGLRRIERGERRVDVDELLALAFVLGVAVVDLLVPGDAPDHQAYDVTPNDRATVAAVRDWIGGQGFLSAPVTPGELANQLQWMPPARAAIAARDWLMPEDREWLEEAEQEEGRRGRPDQED